MTGQLSTWAEVHQFMFAGNATITLVSRATGTRFTYKVRISKPSDDRPNVHFVNLLNGPDNTSDFAYMGVIDAHGFHATTNSRVTPSAPSFKAFEWMLRHMAAGGDMPDLLEVWHEGSCGRCGRKLTVPASVASGIGPECAGRLM